VIRILVYSCDPKVEALLGAALGSECHVSMESDPSNLLTAASNAQTDIVLLDLDSNYLQANGQFKLPQELTASGVSVVAMATDEARPTATDLVQEGLFGYCRKPPAMRELKALIHRAHDHTLMKRELESKRAAERDKEAQATCFDGLIGTSAPIKRVCNLI